MLLHNQRLIHTQAFRKAKYEEDSIFAFHLSVGTVNNGERESFTACNKL